MQTKSQKPKAQVPSREDGQVGIRATLNNMGFSNSAIGYDETNGMVTLNGKHLIKPGFMDEDAGVSYAREQDIQKSVADFYQNSSNPVVRVSDAYATAAGKYGLTADALSYSNDGTVAIGGTPLDILYIDQGGKSWAYQDTVQNATLDYANRVGVQSPMDLAEYYAETYLNDAATFANQLANQKSFSYDPAKDPVFQAYQKHYQLEGQRASQNAAASYAAFTGGYGNSAAATAGAQASQYYAQQLSNVIPELAQQAYDRYARQYQNDLSLLDAMVDLYNTAYQNSADANLNQRDNSNAAAASNVARDTAAVERNEAAQDRAWENLMRAWQEEDRDWAREKHAWDQREQEWLEKNNQQLYDIRARESAWEEQLNPLTMIYKAAINEQLSLSNQKEQILLKYYDQMLQSDLNGNSLDHDLKRLQLKLRPMGLW